MIQKEIAQASRKQKTKKQTAVEPGLFVGLEDGRIFYIALRTGQHDAITIPGSEENSQILSSILLLDGKGAPVIPTGIPWEEFNLTNNNTTEDEEENKSKFNDDDDVEVELVIKNLDEEHKNSPARNSPSIEENTEIAIEDRKFLLVCSGKFITIYALPSYNIYSVFECEDTPESANVVERDNGNYCLIVFLSSGDLKILTLMDLLEIKTIPQALQNIGVQFDPHRLKHDINCTTDGRFVVLSKYQEVIRGSLFADENL